MIRGASPTTMTAPLPGSTVSIHSRSTSPSARARIQSRSLVATCTTATPPVHAYATPDSYASALVSCLCRNEGVVGTSDGRVVNRRHRRPFQARYLAIRFEMLDARSPSPTTITARRALDRARSSLAVGGTTSSERVRSRRAPSNDEERLRGATASGASSVDIESRSRPVRGDAAVASLPTFSSFWNRRGGAVQCRTHPSSICAMAASLPERRNPIIIVCVVGGTRWCKWPTGARSADARPAVRPGRA